MRIRVRVGLGLGRIGVSLGFSYRGITVIFEILFDSTFGHASASFVGV